MTQLGSPDCPVRVAIVGSGPAGFYAAEHLFKRKDLVVTVDMFDRLATPFGLVRFGVAPDHQKIKKVTAVFDRVATHPGFRFFGNVDVGQHVTLDHLECHYHQICLATGAQTDRRMGIPGEDLIGSHPATEFVAWYNGHPAYRDYQFDLSAERVAVVGIGNVAVDVARILCRTVEELEATDIADYALDALRESRVREVWMLGRRGPAQAAFTNQEVRELGEMQGADVVVRAEDVELDALSQTAVEQANDATLRKKIEIIQSFVRRVPRDGVRRLAIRFLVSPVELFGDAAGRVAKMRVVRNALEPAEEGRLRAVPTDAFEELPIDLVFRSVGYRGVPLSGMPFDDGRGIVPNDRGRVRGANGAPLPGRYVSGWIKRGPSGVIGTNKPDAAETVAAMLEDVAEGRVLQPSHSDRASAEQLVRRLQPACVSYADWRELDQLEIARGKALDRPRVKFTSVEEMLAALGRAERHTAETGS